MVDQKLFPEVRASKRWYAPTNLQRIAGSSVSLIAFKRPSSGSSTCVSLLIAKLKENLIPRNVIGSALVFIRVLYDVAITLQHASANYGVNMQTGFEAWLLQHFAQHLLTLPDIPKRLIPSLRQIAKVDDEFAFCGSKRKREIDATASSPKLPRWFKTRDGDEYIFFVYGKKNSHKIK